MNIILLVLAALVEGVIFVQLPLFGLVPMLLAATLLYISPRQSGWTILTESMAVGLFYDFLRGGDQRLLFFLAYTMLGLSLYLWRVSLYDRFSTKRGLIGAIYLPLVIFSASVLTITPVVSVIGDINFSGLLWMILLQTMLLTLTLASFHIVQKGVLGGKN